MIWDVLDSDRIVPMGFAHGTRPGMLSKEFRSRVKHKYPVVRRKIIGLQRTVLYDGIVTNYGTHIVHLCPMVELAPTKSAWKYGVDLQTLRNTLQQNPSMTYGIKRLALDLNVIVGANQTVSDTLISLVDCCPELQEVTYVIYDLEQGPFRLVLEELASFDYRRATAFQKLCYRKVRQAWDRYLRNRAAGISQGAPAALAPARTPELRFKWKGPSLDANGVPLASRGKEWPSVI